MIEQTTVFLSTVFLCSEFKLENIYFGVNVCGKFNLRGFIFADRWRIAKITTSKNFVPHGTSQTVLIRDIDNTWSFLKKSIVGLVRQFRLSACKVLAWRIRTKAITKSFRDLFLYVRFKAFFFF